MTITALLVSADAIAEAPLLRRGAFAFQYAAKLTPEQLAWYSRFSVLVTHDPAVAQLADRQIHIRDGRIEREERRGAGVERPA